VGQDGRISIGASGGHVFWTPPASYTLGGARWLRYRELSRSHWGDEPDVASLAEQAHDHAITYYVAGQVTISWLLCRA